MAQPGFKPWLLDCKGIIITTRPFWNIVIQGEKCISYIGYITNGKSCLNQFFPAEDREDRPGRGQLVQTIGPE